MSDTTPPEGTRRPTGTTLAIVRLADGQDALGDAVGELSREVHSIATELEGYGGGFGDAKGPRAQAEKHAATQLELILREVQSIGTRLTMLEGHVGRLASRISGAEMALGEVMHPARNGGRHDG